MVINYLLYNFIVNFFRKHSLPSSFLARQEERQKLKKSCKEFIYERDIICLPNSFNKDGYITIPRSKPIREMLARSGLMGKIHLTSSMSESEIMDEIQSVFEKPMKCNPNFAFKILQPTSGSSKGLSIPSLSSSFKWTASAIAGKSNKVTIYILAEDELQVSSVYHKLVYTIVYRTC